MTIPGKSIALVVLFGVITSSGPTVTLQNETSSLHFTTNKRIKGELEKMIYVEGGQFINGFISTSNVSMTSNDSTLLSSGGPKKTSVESFYIAATEVTNSEWHTFYMDKVAEVGASDAKANYFPDTAVWVTDFPYSYNRPMAENYYAHPKFKNYPVVGITWDQAKAYCQWKSDKINALLIQEGTQSTIKFDLPTEEQWEYASMKNNTTEDLKNHPVYPWACNGQIWDINQLTNIGVIKDVNDVQIKGYGDDGCLYTCEVASYPPNERGLYDMSGNVAEWTRDDGYINVYDFENKAFSRLHSSSSIQQHINKINKSGDDERDMKQYVVNKLTHDRQVLSKKDTKIAKGGSWAHSLIYTQIGSRQAISKKKASSTTGFRIAISDVNKQLKKYFPKKKWNP